MSEASANPTVGVCVAVALGRGQELPKAVGPHFGRAPRFLLIRDGGERTTQTLDNPHAEAVQGAGPATASLLKRHGVTTVLAGQFGPKAEEALRAGGILPVTVAAGTDAEEAVARLQAGTLEGVG
jgi:predicted Fe-Mo cluster-binding NifX family protein